MITKTEKGKISIQINGKWREIGELDGDTLIVFRDKSKHLFRNFNAYGFSKDLIENRELFDYVLVEEKDKGTINKYLISRQEIINHGRYYKSDDFEKQIFIDLDKLQQFKV